MISCDFRPSHKWIINQSIKTSFVIYNWSGCEVLEYDGLPHSEVRITSKIKDDLDLKGIQGAETISEDA